MNRHQSTVKKQQHELQGSDRTGANAGNRENSSSRQTGSDGTANSTGTKPKYVGPDCISKLMAEMRRTGATEQYLIQQCGIRSLREVTEEQYADIMYKFSCTASRGQRAAG